MLFDRSGCLKNEINSCVDSGVTKSWYLEVLVEEVAAICFYVSKTARETALFHF